MDHKISGILTMIVALWAMVTTFRSERLDQMDQMDQKPFRL